MSILTSIYNSTVGRAFGKPMVTVEIKQTSLAIATHQNVNTKKRKRDVDEDMENYHPTERRRREGSDTYTSVYEDASYPGQKLLQSGGRGYGTTQVLHPNDRMLMPPPVLTQTSCNSSKHTTSPPHFNSEDNRGINLTGAMDFDTASQMSIQQRSSLEVAKADEYDMERARRHAAATTLPPNSGIWERAEKDLFFHLSLRGFEPMLPKEWMKDFPTLPISLYHIDANQGEPMIQVGTGKGKEFRAIKALRELLDIGRDVRDKVISSPGTNARTEDLIERAIMKYLAWAFADADLDADLTKLHDRKRRNKRRRPSKSLSPPIHIICKQRPSQTTTDCLLALKRQMHQLAARHRDVRGIYDSIEHDPPTPGSDKSHILDETTVLEETEDDLPVIYGLMICRSVLAIFTLNSQTPAPTTQQKHPPSMTREANTISETSTEVNARIKRSILASPTPAPSDPDLDNNSLLQDDSGGDPRYISDFDFSDSSKDVWNSLVIVIVAMQIRRDMLSIKQAQNLNGRSSGSRQNSVVSDPMVADEDSDPDA